jgi:hypothetical protein
LRPAIGIGHQGIEGGVVAGEDGAFAGCVDIVLGGGEGAGSGGGGLGGGGEGDAERAAAARAGCVAAAARLRAETAKLRTTAWTMVRTTGAREVAAPSQCTAF